MLMIAWFRFAFAFIIERDLNRANRVG